MILEFVVAVYVSIFFVVRVIFSNKNDRKANMQYEKFSKWRSKFIADWDEESKIGRYVKDKSNRGDILDKLSDNLKVIFGDDYGMVFLDPKQYLHKGSVNHVQWAKHLLLSKMGKCHGLLGVSGFQLGGLDDIELSIKFCREIEKNIRKFHPDFTLVLIGKPKFDNKKRLIGYEYSQAGNSLMVLNPKREDKNYRRLW